MDTGNTKVYKDKAFIKRVTHNLNARKKAAKSTNRPELRKASLALSAFNKAIGLVKRPSNELHEIYLSTSRHEEYRDEFKLELVKAGLGKATIKNYRSGLKYIREQIVLSTEFQKAQKLQTKSIAPLSIGETIKLLGEYFEPQLTINLFTLLVSEITGIVVGTVRNWTYNGGQPISSFRPALAKLEVRYQLKSGILQGKCAIPSAETKKNKGIKDKWVSSLELPQKVMKQIEEVVMFKVTGKLPTRDAAFNDDPDLPIEIRGGKKWTTDSRGNAISANFFLKGVERYMTWLHHVKNIAIEDLDLSMACRLRLLKEYKDGLNQGSACSDFTFGGVTLNSTDNNDYQVAFSNLLSLFRAVRAMTGTTGFLSNYYKPDDVTNERWFKEQVMLSDNLKIWIDTVKSASEKDVQEKKEANKNDELVGGLSNIQPLLNLGKTEALDGWKEIMQTLRSTAKSNAASYSMVKERAISYMATAVWMAMMLETPLRSKNWSLLALADGACSDKETLVFDKESGLYTLNAPTCTLKTRRATSSARSVSHTYQPVTSVIIGEYLDMRAKRLEALRKDDHNCFLITPRKGETVYYKDEKGKEGNRIACAIKLHTGRAIQQLWPDADFPKYTCINFHAGRHAVQYFVESLGGDIADSAALLGDSIAVTIKHYRDNGNLDGDKASELAAKIANY